MTRKVTCIKYHPENHSVEVEHNDGSVTNYVATIASQVRLEYVPFRFLTSFTEIAGKVTIYIRSASIKINW